MLQTLYYIHYKHYLINLHPHHCRLFYLYLMDRENKCQLICQSYTAVSSPSFLIQTPAGFRGTSSLTAWLPYLLPSLSRRSLQTNGFKHHCISYLLLCNKLLQIQQLKTTNIYYLTWFLRVKNSSVVLVDGFDSRSLLESESSYQLWWRLSEAWTQVGGSASKMDFSCGYWK